MHKEPVSDREVRAHGPYLGVWHAAILALALWAALGAVILWRA